MMKLDIHAYTHQYQRFGDQYARLGFTDTYYLGFRDVPLLIEEFKIQIGTALDHGCGAGRGVRLLKEFGFKVIGVDKNREMIAHARELDPQGDYRWIPKGCLDDIQNHSVDLVFQSSVLEEYSSKDAIIETLCEFKRILHTGGKVLIITASENLPKGEWASFLYPDREKHVRSGEQVRCCVRNSDIAFSDYYWTHNDLSEVFTIAGFKILAFHQPLAVGDEPYQWRDETTKSPWSVYVLEKIDHER